METKVVEKAKKDLKTRQEAVVTEMNQNIAQRQQLEVRFRELVKEADMLNGEARMLKRLSNDGSKGK